MKTFAFVAADVATMIVVGSALAAWIWIVGLLVRDDLTDEIRGGRR